MYICRLQQSSSAFTPSLRPIVPWERDMEKRKSHSRFMSSRFRMTGGGRPGNATAVILGQSSSPSSGGESSPLRRKSISITPYHNTADELSPTNDYQTASPCQLSSPLQQDFSVIVTSSRSPARRKPLSRKLRKQRSADELQIRGLWPSTKKPGASAIKSTLEDHLKDEDRLSDMVESYNKVEDLRPTVAHAATTFSFRQRTSSESCRIEDSGSNKLRRSKQNRPLGGSMRHQKENFRIEGSLKKPGTPPSPSSSSSSANGPPPTARILSGRLSVDEKVLARRRSEFGLEFASTESERSEIKIPSPRISRAPVKIAIRRPGSPVRRSRSPVVRSSNSPVLRRSGSPVRRSGSPARRSGSPARLSASPVAADLGGKAVPGRCRPSPVKGGSGGMGSFISLGLGNLFRRKSFSSTTMPSPQPPSTIETVVTGSPVKGKAVTLAVGWQARGTASTIGSPARGAATTIGSPARGAATTIGSPARGAAAAVGSPSRAVAVAVDLQHKSKMVHNHLIQWRFLNACRAMVSKLNWTAAERNLMSAWLGLSDLQLSVAQKRLQLDKHKLCFKLSALLPSQMMSLEKWGSIERQHMVALSSTKDSLLASVCRLPLTDHAKGDPQLLSILLRQAMNLAAAINSNISNSKSTAQKAVPLLAELAEIVAQEKPLLEECLELLGLLSTLQDKEESLRCHLIQFKSQQRKEHVGSLLQPSWHTSNRKPDIKSRRSSMACVNNWYYKKF